MTADAVGGVWTYALDLAEGLAARGWRTTLAVLGPAPGMSQRLQARQVPGLDLHLTSLPLDWLAEDPGELKRT
ncbi:glycosyltransferase, partial [Roseomonas sp. DSM 102946]|nr:glycosyltransferase [Roseomonas sp. DSM 102946]